MLAIRNMRVASEVDDDHVNKYPERKCSVRIAIDNLSDDEVARKFSECGFNPATDFKCIQKVSAYIVIFRSYLTKEKCLKLVERFAAAMLEGLSSS